MAETDHKRLADQVWDEVWHQGNLDRIDELFALDFVRHDPGRELRGIAQNRQFIAGQRAAFPDGRFTVEDHFEAGNKIAIRYRFEGTHSGPFQGMPPSGKRVTYSAILIYRIENGKIAEQWTELDLLGMLRQLGVVPTSK
jgi:steroid delta-isomerase-like uncharacterized protein